MTYTPQYVRKGGLPSIILFRAAQLLTKAAVKIGKWRG